MKCEEAPSAAISTKTKKVEQKIQKFKKELSAALIKLSPPHHSRRRRRRF
jgi:hypothetical protein